MDNSLIKRQAAIDATWFEPSYTDPLNVLTEVRDRLKALPSIQPERKKGKWILECDAEGEGDNLYRCPECGCNYSCQEYDIPNFCPNCGSYNGGESDDKG